MKVGRRTGDLASGFVWLLLAVWYLWESLARLDFYTPGGQPGAGFMPTLLGGGLVLLSCMLIFRAWISPPDLEVRFHVDKSVLKPIGVLGALAVWVAVFLALGYVISGWLLVSGLIFAFAPAASLRRRLGLAVLIGGVAVVGFYVVFAVIFILQLPPSPFLGI